MKKIFTLLTGIFVAFSAMAQEELPAPVSYTIKRNATPAVNEETGYKTVTLLAEDESPVITCEFLDGTSPNGPEYYWDFSKGDFATTNDASSGNGLQVKFIPNYGGTLEIYLVDKLANNKSVNMFVDDNTNDTLNGANGEEVLVSGQNHVEIPAGSAITYTLQKGKTYTFFAAGTKWKFKKFAFTPTDNIDAGVEKTYKVGVVSPSGENDYLAMGLAAGFNLEGINSAETRTLEELQEYDVLLVSNLVTKEDAIAPVLREAVSFQPMVNMSAGLVEAWGLGSVTPTESYVITYPGSLEGVENPADVLSKTIFADIDYADGVTISNGQGLPVVTPGEYFKNDEVLANLGEAAYILKHNSMNSHILFPLNADFLAVNETLWAVVANTVKAAGKTKKTVTKAAAPRFSAQQGNLETFVTIEGKGDIYYAIGADADPVENGTLYTEPIKITEDKTIIKAYAVQDGYLPSDVAPYEVEVAKMAEKPQIDIKPGEGKSAVITFTAEEGAEVHFSFSGQAEAKRTDKDRTEVYAGEPIVVYEPTYVYAFAIGDGLLASELAEDKVVIPGVDATNICLDVVSHFAGDMKTAKLDDGEPYTTTKNWAPSYAEATGVTMVASGQKPWSMYSEITPGANEGEYVKTENPDALHVMTYAAGGEDWVSTPDWKILTQGTTFTMETTEGTNLNYLAKNGESGVSCAADLISVVPTKGFMNNKGSAKSKGSDGTELQDPFSLHLESVNPFKAPFEIHVFVRKGSSKDSDTDGAADIEISTDGKTWNKVGEATSGSIGRQTKKTRVQVSDAGDYYVRVSPTSSTAAISDVYILNNGPKSQEYDASVSGLEEVVANEAAEVISVEYYNLNGIRIAEPANGFYIQRSILSNGTVEVKKIVK